jgi:hypothetical protein
MKLQHLLLVALLIAGSGIATAQQASDLSEVDDDDRAVSPFGLSVDEVEDMNIANTAGEKIAEVEEVLEDGAGQIVAVAIDVEDGILDDDDDRVIGLDELQLTDDRFTTELTQAQIEATPRWDD